MRRLATQSETDATQEGADVTSSRRARQSLLHRVFGTSAVRMVAVLKASTLLRRTRLVLGVLTVLAVLGAAPAQANTPTAKVMSRNLYLGADLTPAIQATSFSQLLAADAQIFTAVHATDFPSRAKVLAREIKDADPDL